MTDPNEKCLSKAYSTGLTKREHFAALAMQGLLASCNYNGVHSMNECASNSVAAADALIEALNEEPK